MTMHRTIQSSRMNRCVMRCKCCKVTCSCCRVEWRCSRSRINHIMQLRCLCLLYFFLMTIYACTYIVCSSLIVFYCYLVQYPGCLFALHCIRYLLLLCYVLPCVFVINYLIKKITFMLKQIHYFSLDGWMGSRINCLLLFERFSIYFIIQ